MTKEMKETVRQYLLLQSTTSFGISFISAFYVTFLLLKGLNYMEINLVNFFFWVTLFVCELPTGAFADIYGRKKSYVISCCLFGVGMLIYGFAQSFWGFVLAEVVSAVGQTFSSGAFNAWMVDRLKQQGFTGSFAPIFARKQQLGNIIGIVSAISGAFLGTIWLPLPWFMAGSVMLSAGCLAMVFMKEDFKKKDLSFADDLARMKETVVDSVRYSLSSKPVRFILVVGMFQWFAVQAPNMQWQPFFRGSLSSQVELGYVKAGISICLMIGASIAPWFLGKIKDERKSIALIQIVVGFGIVGTVLSPLFGTAFAVFMGHEIARGMLDPLKETYLQDNIPQDKRATIASCDSMSMRVGGIIGLLVTGALAQYVSLPSAWIVSGLVLTIAALFLLRNSCKN
ncbi:MAG: MFS transporter [Candidatus Pacebacteria bacterium]|nr:MFS transporter [Candidatus Paceibacterota bacterium]